MTFLGNPLDKTAQIMDCKTSISGDLVIPETVEGLTVTAISTAAFENCNKLTSVKIPNTVTTIWSEAFKDCYNLQSVQLSSALTELVSGTFENCRSLSAVDIPTSVTEIGYTVFQGCSSLSSVTIPNSVKTIGLGAFENCRSLANIEIPSSVTDVGQSAFSGCTALTSIVLPNSVTKIGSSAFKGCTALASAVLPDSITDIGTSMFDGCTNLTKVEIPGNVKRIYNYAFRGCSNLKEISIPNSVTFFYSNVFENCSSLTSVRLPDALTSINSALFKNCTSLTSINLPNTIRSIGTEAFRQCSSLASIDLPDSLMTIGRRAFYGCNGLKTVAIPNIELIIEGQTSGGSILDHAFGNCFNLASVSIPKSVMSISPLAFSGSSNITSFTVDPANEYYTAIDRILYDKGMTTIIAAYGTLQSAAIPEGVTRISDYAFYLSRLTAVTIPGSVTSIGHHAFSQNYFRTLDIPNSVDTIGPQAFGDCPFLESIRLSNSLATISDNMFCRCTRLSSVEIPGSVNTIGISAFKGCRGLKTIALPASVTAIKDSAFIFCDSLVAISLSRSTQTVGTKAFQGCRSLKSISIPASVTSIGDNAFQACSSLEELTIPNSVTDVEFTFNSFSGCTALKRLYLSEHTSLGQNAFAYKNSEGYSIMYPLDSLELLSVGSLEHPIGYYFAFDGRIGNTTFQAQGGKGITQGDKTIYHFSSSLKTLEVRKPDTIPDHAFENLYFLNVRLTGPITHIGEAALDNSGIKEVILGGNTGLVAETFRNCPNLESVVVENSVKELSAGLFRYCVNLQSLELPFPGADSASNVSNFGQLFGTTPADGMRAVVQESESGEKATYYLPANLRKLVLSEGCEMIPYGGLYNCNMLDTLVLPTTLYMVGDKALYGCSKLKDIFCKGADPAAAYDETFTGVRVSSCKLHIPYNTTELYRRSPGWENFYYFEEEAPIAIVVEKTIEYAGVIYGLDEYRPGQTAELRAVAHHGYRFEGWMENDELITTDADLTFTVTDSRSLVARFVPVPDEGAIGVTPQPDGVSLHLNTVEGASSYVADIYADESLSVLVTSATTDVSTARSTRDNGVSVSAAGLAAETTYYYLLTAYSLPAHDGTPAKVLAQFTGRFRTTSGTGIDNATRPTPTVTARYDASGRRLVAPAKGLNILRMSDGTTRKVFVK